MSERAGKVLGVALTREVLSAVWSSLQARHPDLPPAVFELSPSARTSGHDVNWSARPVRLIIGPAMTRRAPAEILEWLLHEAAHAMAEARSPLSPGKRKRGWHTEAFRDAARELGLEVSHTTHFGWRDTSLPPALTALGPSLIWLAAATGHLEPPAATKSALPA
ncbi:MAG: hypothetical protein ACRDRJ_00750 [Streptosporangiaceae bacterium]